MLMRAKRGALVFCVVWFTGGLLSTAWGQQADSAAVRADFDSIMTANTYTMSLEDGQLRGDGVDWLVEQARGAHHFMIGERHGTAEIPAISGALYKRLMSVGYTHAVLEIGPHAARDVRSALDRGKFDALRKLLASYDPVPIAFLDAREEARLAARIHDAGGTIWGIDRALGASLPLHLDALAQQAETEPERSAVRTVRARRDEWAENRTYVGNVRPETLRLLRTAFERRGDQRALARIDALLTSNEILRPYVRTGGSFYRSTVKRENYMKRVLVDHVRRAERQTEEAPRIFYKLGGWHSARHPGTTLDPRVFLGTFVAEWARTLRGEDTFHMYVDCKGGTVTGSGQAAEGACTPFVSRSGDAGARPFAKYIRADRITVLDLTALRDRYADWDFLRERDRSLINEVDAYMVVPDVSPQTPLSPLGDGGNGRPR